MKIMRSERNSTGLSRTRQKQKGAATAMDMMLTFPLFATMMLFIIQMALVLHAYTVVHYSAYKAARAARVHLLDGDHAFLELEVPEIVGILASVPNAVVLASSVAGDGVLTDLIPNTRERVNASAMNQLISISPASDGYSVGGQGDSWHEQSVSEFLAAASIDYVDRTNPLVRKARYAYSEHNTKVEFKFINFQNPILQEGEDLWRIFETVTNTPLHSQINVPVTVTVSYRYELQIPVGQWFFSNDPTRPHGRWMEATVKLM